MTIERVSTDLLGSALFDFRGLSNETWGQTVFHLVTPTSSTVHQGLTSSRVFAVLCIIHQEDEWFRLRLVLKPIPDFVSFAVVETVRHLPLLMRSILKVVYFSNAVREYSISWDQLFGVDSPGVANGQRTVFENIVQWSPCASGSVRMMTGRFDMQTHLNMRIRKPFLRNSACLSLGRYRWMICGPEVNVTSVR
jgi:hypothetical protein